MDLRLLSGIKVIDLTTYAAGQACTRVLSDWGADVIKVEPLSGQAYRFWQVIGTPFTEDENPIFELDNADKRCIAVDLKTSEGLKIMHGLFQGADVFVTNNRLKAIKNLKLSYDEAGLCLNPDTLT